MASRNMFWHVPNACWHPGQIAGGTGNQNNARDIVVPLISTNPATNLAVPEDASDFVVKRIVGQYLIQGSQAVAENYIIHNRVYPTLSDAGSIGLRNLDTSDDAESDFLWHLVQPWQTAYDGDLWGNWQEPSGSGAITPFRNGRLGDVDITVSRRIADGQDLIWHTQFTGGNAPADFEFDLYMWIRMLMVRNR